MLMLQWQRSVYYIIHNHSCLHVQYLKITQPCSWLQLTLVNPSKRYHRCKVEYFARRGVESHGVGEAGNGACVWKPTRILKKCSNFSRQSLTILMSSLGLTHKQTHTRPFTCLNSPYHTFQPLFLWSNLQNKSYILRRSVPHLPLIDKEVTGNITHVS